VIIGLTGENCAGKGVTAEYLKKKSFYYLSLSDVIREELAAESADITRESMIRKGNEMRKKSGPGVLAQKVVAKLDHDKNYVVDSIRTPGEVAELKKRKDFVLLCVTASQESRFARMRTRDREGDPKTFDAFMTIEKREATSTDGAGQQLVATMKLADKKIVNDGDFAHLYDEIDAALAGISPQFRRARPSWDDYFMAIAKVVASRSNCMKRKVAAIIVRDKRIISTGYNGTPRGVKNCDEGGCPRCNNYADGGTKLEECLCSHGEENAIVQSAYHGIAIKGGTLYTTYSPCLTCAKMIVNSGIVEVVYNTDYPMGETALKLLKEAGVQVRQHKV